MPYKHETNGLKLRDFGQDRRIKLTDQDKVNIVKEWICGASIHSLSRKYKVCRRVIQFILFPDRQKHCLELRKARGGEKQYYGTKKHTEYIRETRRHRQRVFGGQK